MRVELRGEPGKETVTIDGYVNVTGRESRPIPDKKGGYFIEKIQKGAFKKALDKADEVKTLLNHQWDRVLGSTKKNLKLAEDEVGLRAHVEISDLEVVKLAREKRLRGWSFDIRNPSETRAEGSGGIPIRTITDFDIREVSLIAGGMNPWYPGTTVEVRADDGQTVEAEIRAEESEPEYIGFEEKPDNSKLKNMIQKYGGSVNEK